MKQVRTYADIVDAHAPALLRLAVMLTGHASDAEDLLQSTLLRATPHGERISAMEAPAAYLRRIMVNEHASAGRRLLRRVRTTGSTFEPSVPDGQDHAAIRDEVWRWLATLSPRQRAVLVLRFYEDLPDAAIAELLGCSVGTVRSNVSRGLAALRTQLPAKEES